MQISKFNQHRTTPLAFLFICAIVQMNKDCQWKINANAIY